MSYLIYKSARPPTADHRPTTLMSDGSLSGCKKKKQLLAQQPLGRWAATSTSPTRTRWRARRYGDVHTTEEGKWQEMLSWTVGHITARLLFFVFWPRSIMALIFGRFCTAESTDS